MIFTLVMAFVIRRGLNSLVHVPRTHPAWFHGFWTFLFGIFYLQWKINKNLRSRESLVNKASTTETLSIENPFSGSTDQRAD